MITRQNDPLAVIVVLNYNGWQDTVECLESLFANDYSNYQVVVVDNASTNSSCQFIEEWAEGTLDSHSVMSQATPKKPVPFVKYSRAVAEGGGKPEEVCVRPRPLVIIETGENLGFARGNNVGIRYALQNGADYVCALNNDTIVDKDFIAKSVSFLEVNEAALIGPKILDTALADWQWPVQARFSTLGWILVFSGLRRLVKNSAIYKSYFCISADPTEVYAVPGSCMFFRAAPLAAIGLFDEKTFIYWEEFIVAEKLALNGYKTVYYPRTTIIHKWNRSIEKIGPIKFLHHCESELYFFRTYMRYNWFRIGAIKLYRATILVGRMLVHKSFRSLAVGQRFIKNVLLN